MNKIKKYKFAVNINFAVKKFFQLTKKKDGSYLAQPKTIYFSVLNSELKKRIQFVLSLLCDYSSELSIRFCEKEEMLASNSMFRKKNYPTDVLSFPSQAQEFNMEYQYLGDILICLPVCHYQAKGARNTFAAELERMIIHGIVHLKGFDHERNEHAHRVMSMLEKTLQKELIQKMGDPNWCQIR